MLRRVDLAKFYFFEKILRRSTNDGPPITVGIKAVMNHYVIIKFMIIISVHNDSFFVRYAFSINRYKFFNVSNLLKKNSIFAFPLTYRVSSNTNLAITSRNRSLFSSRRIERQIRLIRANWESRQTPISHIGNCLGFSYLHLHTRKNVLKFLLEAKLSIFLHTYRRWY